MNIDNDHIPCQAMMQGPELTASERADALYEENQQLRDELRRSKQAQQKFQGLLESAPNAMVVVNEEGRIVLVNAQTERIFGYAWDELLDEPLEILLPRRFHERHREHMAGYFLDPKVRSMGLGLELIACRRDGSEFPVEISLSPFMTKDGLLVASVIRDISQRKLKEDALRESEAKFRNIIEASPLGMHMYRLEADGSLILIGANPAANITLGVDHDQLLGMVIEEAFSEIAATEIPEQFHRVAATGEPWSKEHLFYQDERISGAFEIHAFQTAPKNMVAAFANITKRIQSKETLQRLLQVSQSMLSTLDMDEVVGQVLQSLQKVMPNEMCSIYLIDKEAGLLHPSKIAGQEYISETLADWSIPLGEGIMGAVAQSGQGELVNNAQLDPRVVYPHTSHVQHEHMISMPVQIHEEVIGVLNVGRIQAAPFTDEEFELVQLFTAQAAIAIHNAQLYTEADQQRKLLRILARRLANAQEAERKNLARELHDRLGQNLTALDFNLNMISSQLPADSTVSDQLRSQVESSLALLADTGKHMRDVMANLRPPALDDYGLLAALDWYGTKIMKQRDITIAVERREPDPRLAAAVELALLRIAQEAIINTLKHAQATTVKIRLDEALDQSTVRLVVADDGDGFEVEGQHNLYDRQNWGLIGMAERAEAVGAACRIESAPGRGTQVIVEVSR